MILQSPKNNIWYVYIILCGDNTLYTGISKNVELRLEAHRSGKGARYTRGRAPLVLVYVEESGLHGDALRREYQIKNLSRNEKDKLIVKYSFTITENEPSTRREQGV